MAGPSFRAAPVRVRVPATSANLGPGFDAFGLALAMHDDLVVRVTESGTVVDVAGEGADTIDRGEDNLIVRALRAAFDAIGGQPRGLELVCANRIPHGRGLGSSAAAICAGVTAARALTLGGQDRLSDDAALAVAAEIEGHPDNVAACLRGGFTIAWTGQDRRPALLRLDVAPSVRPVLFVPGEALPTSTARALLPRSVPHADAARNAGRAGLLVAAITQRPDLLLCATEDWLHQRYRAKAMSDSAELIASLRGKDIPAVVSGAGPTVLALADDTTENLALVAADSRWAVYSLAVDTGGACVLPLG